VIGIFIAAPWLVIAPVLLFVALYWRSRHRAALIAAVLWAGYGLYEEGMRRRILCTGECNIRVDLLLIYPILFAVSLLAILRAVRSLRRPSATG
jgi:hypothetical protein